MNSHLENWSKAFQKHWSVEELGQAGYCGENVRTTGSNQQRLIIHRPCIFLFRDVQLSKEVARMMEQNIVGTCTIIFLGIINLRVKKLWLLQMLYIILCI